jgi:hypothetical protein
MSVALTLAVELELPVGLTESLPPLVQTNADAAPDPVTTAERLAQLFRLLTAGFLLFIAFYLQIFAQFGSPTEGAQIPIGYRWPPALLGILILNRTRDNGFAPVETEVLAVVLYATVLYFLWKGFWLILDRYAVPAPRERIPAFVRELIESIRE